MLQLAQDPDADALLDRDPLALLIGMLLDQQFPMERAFAGPAGLAAAPRRATGSTRGRSPSTTPRPSPPCSPARRRCTATPRRWPGGCRRSPRCSSSTTTATPRASGATSRTAPPCCAGIKALPGFGTQKAQIFVALLGKQRGVDPAGLAGGGRARTARTARSGRSPTSSTARRSPASGSSSRRPRPRRRPPPRRSRPPRWTRGRPTAVARWMKRVRSAGFESSERARTDEEAIVSHPQRRPGSSSPDPVLITDAAQSYEDELKTASVATA